jgi:hypothetical protein
VLVEELEPVSARELARLPERHPVRVYLITFTRHTLPDGRSCVLAYARCPRCGRRRRNLYRLGAALGCIGCLPVTYQSKRERWKPVPVRVSEDLPGAFSAILRERAGAVMMLGSLLHSQNLMRIAELARKANVPTISSNLRFPEVGGFMAYAATERDIYRRAATYVDRILKGAKPGDLPIEQPTKFELVINLKTAKALGLTIPPSVLARADQVIE